MRIMTTAKERICPDCKKEIKIGEKVLWVLDKNVCMDCASSMPMEYVMVWVHEEEKWYYFLNSFDGSQFPDGYVAYTILVDKDGIIYGSNYRLADIGKPFAELYPLQNWFGRDNNEI